MGHFWRIPPPPEMMSPCQSVPPAWHSPPSCYVGYGVLLEGIDHGMKIGRIDVVIDVAIGVGNTGVFRTEPPLSVHDELVLMQSSW